jgi:hypothetical protein
MMGEPVSAPTVEPTAAAIAGFTARKRPDGRSIAASGTSDDPTSASIVSGDLVGIPSAQRLSSGALDSRAWSRLAVMNISMPG